MKQRRKGLFLIDSLNSGGAQRQFVELLRGLDQLQIEPVAITYHDLDFFSETIQSEGIRHVLIPKSDKIGFGVMLELSRLAKAFQPHFIHSFLNIPNFYARMLKFTGYVSKVITSERNISISASKSLCAIEKACWRLSDQIIVNAVGIRDVLINQIGVHPNRISVVYNGVSIESFSQFDTKHVDEIRSDIGLPLNRGILIGLIGRLAEQKNHRLLIEAVAKVKRRIPGEMIKVGFWGQETEKGYRKLLEWHIQNHNLGDDIRFFDQEKDMPSVYAACDAVVLPSLWEGFPNVIIEGMAASRVVIASHIVDNAMLVKDGKTGFLTKPNSVSALSDALMKMIQMSAEARILLGKRAQKHIAENFTSDKMVHRTMAVYNKMGLLRI